TGLSCVRMPTAPRLLATASAKLENSTVVRNSPASKPFGYPASARSFFARAGSYGYGSMRSAKSSALGMMLPVSREDPLAPASVDGLAIDGQRRREAHAPVAPRGFRVPLLRELEPPRRRRDHPGEPELRVRLHRLGLEPDHQIGQVRLAGLQHREPRRAI